MSVATDFVRLAPGERVVKEAEVRKGRVNVRLERLESSTIGSIGKRYQHHSSGVPVRQELFTDGSDASPGPVPTNRTPILPTNGDQGLAEIGVGHPNMHQSPTEDPASPIQLVDFPAEPGVGA